MGLEAFADDVVNLLAQLDESQIAADRAERCRESCAAVWSASVAALESSALTRDERQHLAPLLLEALLPCWRRHCSDEPDIIPLLSARTSHYLQQRDPDSQIRTAASLVNRLMLRLGIAPATQLSIGKPLTALFAHRMLGDTIRIDEVRARFGIDLPLVAALAAILEVTVSPEPVLRVLRFV
jgi:hypothetical protein